MITLAVVLSGLLALACWLYEPQLCLIERWTLRRRLSRLIHVSKIVRKKNTAPSDGCTDEAV